MTTSNEELLCGLDGEDNEAVKISQFNRWVARAIRSHVQPLKEKQEAISRDLLDHIHKEELMLAEIKGGVKALKYMVPAVNAIVLLVIYLLHKAGVL